MPNNPGPSTKTPAGHIRVWDKQLGMALGVPNLRMVARRWFKVDHATTNNDGYFQFNKTFRNKVHVLVKFKHSHIELRQIKKLRFWGLWFPIKTGIGKYSGVLNNINYTFHDDNTASTNQHVLWFAGTVNRSYVDFNNLAAQQGIAGAPDHMKILLTTHAGDGVGSTPMNGHRPDAGAPPPGYISYFIAQNTGSTALLFNYLYNAKLLVRMDMSLNYQKSNWSSSEARELIYHELSHASHYTQVGNAWWSTLVYAEAAETARFISAPEKQPYGDGNAIGDLSDHIAVAEGWSYYIGHFLTDLTYGTNSASTSLMGFGYAHNNPVFNLTAHLNAVESFNPNAPSNPHRWIPVGMFYDLIDSRAELTPVQDGVNGYTNQQLFNALSSDVKSIPQFRNKLLLNSGNNQQTQVNTLVNSYGY